MESRERLFAEDPVRYIGPQKADIRFQDGGLRHAIGVHSHQVVRACRDKRYAADGCGWTYNHAPMLAWWNGCLVLEYLSNPVSEHVPPSQVFFCRSQEGRKWSDPQVLFGRYRVPAQLYQGPGRELLEGVGMVEAVAHHRMGFYVSREGRLLAQTFYGICPEPHINPNNGWGICRVVREVYADWSFSSAYVLHYNTAAGFSEENTPDIPYYRRSGEAGFRRACEELLENRMMVQQWWEEERFDPELFTRPGARALSWYTLPDGRVMGVFKDGYASLTEDDGRTWTPLVQCHSIETSGGKVWGERTGDGRYALAYNPTTDGAHRWPLAVVTGEDGQCFDNLLAVTTEVSPCRYSGLLKNFGPQYVRGICEGNPRPDDGAMWVAYSVNKEDIWVSRIPLPVEGQEKGDVCDTFAGQDVLDRWNLYIPKWCSVKAVRDKGERYLQIVDGDPWDMVKAERVVQRASLLELHARVRVDYPTKETALFLDCSDEKGALPLRLVFRADGYVYAKSGGAYLPCCRYRAGEWYDLKLDMDCNRNRYMLKINRRETEAFHDLLIFCESVHGIERISFSTKERFSLYNLEQSGKKGIPKDLLEDVPVEEGKYSLDFFIYKKKG